MRKLKDWLTAYLEYTKHSEAPESFHFWTGVGTIAGALRRKVGYQELYYRWSPNFYIIFVAPPAVATKSTALDQGQSLLSEIRGVRFGPASMTWQALVKSLEEAREDVTMPDGTYAPMSCLTFFSSELGSLIDFKDRQMVTVLTDLWDGKTGTWRKATRHFGSDEAVNPWINILGCTTPSWLSDNLPRVLLQGGFVSRAIFVYAESKRKLIAYPSRQVVDMDALKALRRALVHDLEQIAMLKGDFRLTEEAYAFGEEWYHRHHERLKQSNGPVDISGYMGRKQTHLHKLAMVLSASRRDDLTIDKWELETADALLSAIEAEMGTVMRLVQTTEPMEKVQRIIYKVAASGEKGIEKSALYRDEFLFNTSYKEFMEAVESAVNAGAIIVRVEGTKVMLKPRFD